MAEVAGEVDQRKEFWRPAIDDERPREERLAPTPTRTACAECGAALASGARFCQMCGAGREVAQRRLSAHRAMPAWLDLASIRIALGLPTGSLAAFFLGMVCTVAAVVTGFVFGATTLTDWQAVQVWRVEWLLGAIAAFLVGLLLKK